MDLTPITKSCCENAPIYSKKSKVKEGEVFLCRCILVPDCHCKINKIHLALLVVALCWANHYNASHTELPANQPHRKLLRRLGRLPRIDSKQQPRYRKIYESTCLGLPQPSHHAKSAPPSHQPWSIHCRTATTYMMKIELLQIN
jgi:hypothetical protein